MKVKKLLAAALTGAMIFSLAACGSSSGGNSSKKTSKGTNGKNVGISMPTKSLERWNRDGSYLQKQFKAKG